MTEYTKKIRGVFEKRIIENIEKKAQLKTFSQKDRQKIKSFTDTIYYFGYTPVKETLANAKNLREGERKNFEQNLKQFKHGLDLLVWAQLAKEPELEVEEIALRGKLKQKLTAEERLDIENKKLPEILREFSKLNNNLRKFKEYIEMRDMQLRKSERKK